MYTYIYTYSMYTCIYSSICIKLIIVSVFLFPKKCDTEMKMQHLCISFLSVAIRGYSWLFFGKTDVGLY